MTVRKHVHKYRRFDIGRKKDAQGKHVPYIVYKCVLDCTHFLQAFDTSGKVPIPLMKGRRTICWRCGNEFIIGQEHCRMAKPHCSSCMKRKHPELEDTQIEKLIEDNTLDNFMEKFR